MQPSSAAVLCTLLVAILSVARIPCSRAATSAMVTLSAGSGETLVAKVAEMEMRGEAIREQTFRHRLGMLPSSLLSLSVELTQSGYDER